VQDRLANATLQAATPDAFRHAIYDSVPRPPPFQHGIPSIDLTTSSKKRKVPEEPSTSTGSSVSQPAVNKKKERKDYHIKVSMPGRRCYKEFLIPDHLLFDNIFTHISGEFGWSNDHLYRATLPNGKFLVNYIDPYCPLYDKMTEVDAQQTKLEELKLKVGDKLQFVFDEIRNCYEYSVLSIYPKVNPHRDPQNLYDILTLKSYGKPPEQYPAEDEYY